MVFLWTPKPPHWTPEAFLPGPNLRFPYIILYILQVIYKIGGIALQKYNLIYKNIDIDIDVFSYIDQRIKRKKKNNNGLHMHASNTNKNIKHGRTTVRTI